MKTASVDTNVFIRYLTDDDREKADRVEALLSRAAKGEIRLVTTELVIAEVVWVLESSYGLKNADITPIRGRLHRRADGVEKDLRHLLLRQKHMARIKTVSTKEPWRCGSFGYPKSDIRSRTAISSNLLTALAIAIRRPGVRVAAASAWNFSSTRSHGIGRVWNPS